MITGPVIILSAPRSGSSLLFETLARSPDAWTVGGESHWVIEGLPWLHPRRRAWESNRLGAADADPDTVERVRRRFQRAMRDRSGRPAGRAPAELRLLEKTPRNALRIPFVRAVFPGATFVYLYREPVETMSSMLDGWRAGRHVSYPRLPGWAGPPWSFLLVPGWRVLDPNDLARTVAYQWASTMSTLLDDWEAISQRQRLVVRYRDLIENPAEVIPRLCDRLGLRWDEPINGPMPLSSTTLDPPQEDKWRRNAIELGPMLDATAAVASRAARVADSR